MTILEMVLLAVAGCPLFDSVNLAFATAGTGGFGVLNSSAGDYNAVIQIILTVFMILFGVNFNVYFLIYSKNIKDAFKCEEARIYIGIIAAAVLLISVNTYSMFRGRERRFCMYLFRWRPSLPLQDFPLWILSCGRNFPGQSW